MKYKATEAPPYGGGGPIGAPPITTVSGPRLVDNTQSRMVGDYEARIAEAQGREQVARDRAAQMTWACLEALRVMEEFEIWLEKPGDQKDVNSMRGRILAAKTAIRSQGI